MRYTWREQDGVTTNSAIVPALHLSANAYMIEIHKMNSADCSCNASACRDRAPGRRKAIARMCPANRASFGTTARPTRQRTTASSRNPADQLPIFAQTLPLETRALDRIRQNGTKVATTLDIFLFPSSLRLAGTIPFPERSASQCSSEQETLPGFRCRSLDTPVDLADSCS